MAKVAAVAIKRATKAAKTCPGYCAINGNSARKGRKVRARGRPLASSSIWATASAASLRDKVQDPFLVELLRL
jgi:hypothetical protein